MVDTLLKIIHKEFPKKKCKYKFETFNYLVVVGKHDNILEYNVSILMCMSKCVLKWALARIATFCCTWRPQIWIPETEYYQKVSHAQI